MVTPTSKWNTAKIEKLFTYKRSNTLSRDKLNYQNGICKDIHYGDVLVKFGCLVDIADPEIPYITDDNDRAGDLLANGDIIVADTAEDLTVGKACEIIGADDQPAVAGLHTIVLRPKQELFEPGFLGYYFNSDYFHSRITPFAHGTKVTSISKGDLGQLEIVIPPHEEQRVIVTALVNIDSLIRNYEQLISKKVAIAEETARRLLTQERRLPGFEGPWIAHVVGDIGFFYSGLTGKTKHDFGSGSSRYIPFLNVLNNTVIDVNDLQPVDVALDENQNAVRSGDLFFNTSSETPEEVGMCAVLLDDAQNTYLNSFCFGFRLKVDYINPLFLSYLFNSIVGRRVMRVLAQGATRYNLSKEAFSATRVELPKIDEQNAIINILTDAQAEISELTVILDKYKHIRQGMMRELLTGHIRLVQE